MKVTITQDEARELSRRWLETTLDKPIEIDLLPVESFVARIGPEHKIALIKFARKIVEETISGTIVPAIDREGHKYFGLADAKHYVEKYFGWTP